MFDFTTDITPHASMKDANWQLMLEHAARFDAMDNDNVPEGGMGFDLGNYLSTAKKSRHPCGSACCVTGWAEKWSGVSTLDGRWDTADLADYYGITKQNASRIGLPGFHQEQLLWGTNPHISTPQQAAFLIRHLVRTGEVDWPLAMESA